MNDRHDKALGLVHAAIIIAFLAVWPAQQCEAQEHRQLGAHQHGHGTLNLAIEGKTLEAELEVPGADIVGFEHPATTDADKEKIAAARKTLADPSSLFALPAQARCKLTSAKVELEGEEDSAHHEEKHAGHDGEKHAGHDEEKHGEHEGEAIHSEFRVAYAFDCANVAALTQIGFPYFKAFANAQELDVTLITGKGQKTYEVDRKTTRINIRDML